ncbi:MAG: ABC transporter permease [Rhizobiales bacterium]|nr:ABC transporter permease [Hyphomicrobiales bacterium]
MTAARLLRHETILAILTVLALIVLANLSDKFFTAENLLNQGRLMSEVGLVALAMTFVIVTGGIDLSVGSILGMTAILLGVFWQNVGLPLPLAMVAALLRGTLAGLGNGLIITRFKVPPRIATLATLALYRGLAEGISQARSNETAARFSGIRVDATKLWIYTAAGFLAGLAAVIFVSRVTTTRSDMGTGLELDVITGVVLGGTSIFGGKGTIVGTALGLILIQALKNGLALSGVKGDGTIVVIGVVLIAAILAGALFDRNRGG